jgi:hypothetical protein
VVAQVREDIDDALALDDDGRLAPERDRLHELVAKLLPNRLDCRSMDRCVRFGRREQVSWRG